MPDTLASPAPTAGPKDAWLHDLLGLDPAAFAGVPAGPPGGGAPGAGFDPSAIFKVMRELAGVVGSLVQDVRNLASRIAQNFGVCEGQRLVLIGAAVSFAASGTTFIGALTADVTPAAIAGIPATVVTGIAFAASVTYVIAALYNLHHCLEQSVEDAKKEQQRQQHDRALEQRIEQLERALNQVNSSERSIKTHQAEFDRKLQELRRAAGGR